MKHTKLPTDLAKECLNKLYAEAISPGADVDDVAAVRVIQEYFAIYERLVEALKVVLPMARAHAARHDVGNNMAMVLEAQATLDALD